MRDQISGPEKDYFFRLEENIDRLWRDIEILSAHDGSLPTCMALYVVMLEEIGKAAYELDLMAGVKNTSKVRRPADKHKVNQKRAWLLLYADIFTLFPQQADCRNVLLELVSLSGNIPNEEQVQKILRPLYDMAETDQQKAYLKERMFVPWFLYILNEGVFQRARLNSLHVDRMDDGSITGPFLWAKDTMESGQEAGMMNNLFTIARIMRAQLHAYGFSLVAKAS